MGLEFCDNIRDACAKHRARHWHKTYLSSNMHDSVSQLLQSTRKNGDIEQVYVKHNIMSSMAVENAMRVHLNSRKSCRMRALDPNRACSIQRAT